MKWTSALVTGLAVFVGLGSQPAAATGEPPPEPRRELIAEAAGVYRPVEGLEDRLVGYSDVLAVIDVGGELVVRPDGTVTGSLRYTVVQGVDDLIVAVTTIDRTFSGATRSSVDEALSFTTDVEVGITQNEEPLPGLDEVATGSVDDGVIVVTGLFDLESARFVLDTSGSATMGPAVPGTTTPTTTSSNEDTSDGPSSTRLLGVFAATVAAAAVITVYLKRRRS